MLFQMRRYYFGLVKYRIWLIFFVIPPVTFLGVTALIPSKFIVSQDVNISSDTPIASMSSPTATIPAQEFITHPENLFLNPITLRALYTQLFPTAVDYRTDPQFRELADSVKAQMSLRKIDNHNIQFIYSGPDRLFGNAIVSFFSERFIRNAMEGIKRSGMTPAQGQKPNMTGAATTSAQRTLLPPMFITSFLQILIASVLGALILAGILEFKDSSFKSERQMAEYLKLPILGSLPNLNRVYSAMKN